jgi:deoxyadenosine/deoxycytidine kinase
MAVRARTVDGPRECFYSPFVSRYVVIEGPLGVGKTAFAQLLAERLGARLVTEPQVNPFLADFYDDPRRHAFQAQLYFLLSRFSQKDEIQQQDLFAPGGVVGDHLFARDRIFAQLNLSRDELALYDKVYSLLGATVARPDLVVYLQARPDVLWSRLKRRAGDGRLPPREYIDRVAEAYAEFFFHYRDSPVLWVNTSEIDFVESREAFDDLVAVIQRTKAGVSHYSPLGTRSRERDGGGT